MHLRATGKRATAALAASAAAAFALAPAANAASPGAFYVRPGRVDPHNPATKAYFIEKVRAGGVFRDQVVISVPGPKAVDLRVYPVDGLTGVTSGAVYGNRQDRRTGAGRWIKTRVSLIKVPAHGQTAVSFTGRVPAGSAPGDHLAGLAFEGAHPRRSKGRFSVTEVIRAVVGIEIEVPGRASQQLRLRGMALRALPGMQIPSVVVNLGDAGRKLCKPRLEVSLTHGRRSLTVRRQLDTILPGDYIPFPLPWPRPLAGGDYAATATAQSCGRSMTIHRTLHLGKPLRGTSAHPNPPTRVASIAGGDSSLPLVLAVAIGGVLAGAVVSRMRVRARP